MTADTDTFEELDPDDLRELAASDRPTAPIYRRLYERRFPDEDPDWEAES